MEGICMRKIRFLFILLLTACLLLIGSPVFANNGDRSEPVFMDQILVKFKDGVSSAAIGRIHAANGASVIGKIDRLGVQILKVPAGKVAESVQSYRKNSAVDYAEPDHIAIAYGVPNDTYYGQQWGMTQINAPDAWGVTMGSGSIMIAILDTGVDLDHQDLASKIVSSKNFSSSNTVDDKYGHGTHVAGIAAAVTNNGMGVAGVGYNCSIMNVKVLGDTGSGSYSGIISGIIWAADNGAKVINMSLGGSSGSTTLESAVDYAWSKGVVVVAAAGNSGATDPSYPAYYANCIAVAATDANDAKASFSNYHSSNNPWVDVAAPGVNIYSTMPNHRNKIGPRNYDTLSGTSMASPFVAGLAGLVWASSYGTSATHVRDRVESTADTVGTIWSTYGIKRINAYKAVDEGGVPPVNNPPTVYLSSPVNGSSFASGSTIAFAGTAADIDDGDLTSSLVWTSNLVDGIIGSGGSFSTVLIDGTHEITASVTDQDGATAHATITIIIGSQLINSVKVDSIVYTTEGGRTGNAHLIVTLVLKDDKGNPTSGASVTIDLKRNSATYLTATGTTATNGSVTFKVTNAPAGTYQTAVTAVSANGLTWDGYTPANEFMLTK
jgi:thermitase